MMDCYLPEGDRVDSGSTIVANYTGTLDNEGLNSLHQIQDVINAMREAAKAVN